MLLRRSTRPSSNLEAALHGERSCLQDYVTVNQTVSAGPLLDFFRRPTERQRQFFVARFKSVVPNMLQNLRSLRLICSLIVDHMLMFTFNRWLSVFQSSPSKRPRPVALLRLVLTANP